MQTKKMTHPAVKGSIEVRADAVEMHESQGWSVVENSSSSSKASK